MTVSSVYRSFLFFFLLNAFEVMFSFLDFFKVLVVETRSNFYAAI